MNIAKLHAEGRKFRTADGKNLVRIICTDKVGQEPIVYLEKCGGIEFLQSCDNEGGDCIEPVPVEREGWVVITQQNILNPTIWFDREAAYEHAHGRRVARITWTDL